MAALVLARRLLAELQGDARACYPLEGCGILIGEIGGAGEHDSPPAIARELRIESNVHAGARRRRFAIAPEALLRAQKEARAAGLEVIGYYHSHPDAPAVPSSTDREAAWPDSSYLIVPVENGVPGEPRSWRLDPETGSFREERIEYEGA